MRIPSEEKPRDKKLIKVLEACKDSIRERRLRYEKRRRWALFGNDSEQPVRYNRLLAHTDLVSSFLFAADSIRFSLTISGAPTPLDPDIMDSLSDHLRTSANNSSLFIQYSDALLWALIYDSMFLKLGWSAARKQVLAKVVDPYSFAVYDETEGDLDDQEAFVHFFTLSRDDSIRRLLRAGKGREIPRLSQEPEGKDERYPPVYRSLLISATGGANISGAVIGQAQAEYQAPTDYRGSTPPDCVKWAELWIWDGEHSDYRQFLIAGEDIVVEDSKDRIAGIRARAPKAVYGTETNGFLPGEHPFVHICPYRIYDYFWGECHTERLIPLQEWTNERLEQISDILDRQVDPPTEFTGYTGLSQEKAAAFGGPHSWVMEQNPAAKATQHKPDMPPDLFAEFEHIGELFMEASGLTQTIAGKGGEGGVRSQSHAKQLATTGSGRIKKAAYGLEDSLSKLGDMELKLTMHNDATRLQTAAGLLMVAGQIEADVDVRVAGHSHSPLFVDDTKDMAGVLMKFSAIDKESFLKLMNPPGVENLVQRLRRMEAQKQQQGQAPNTKAEDEAKRSHHSQREKGVQG